MIKKQPRRTSAGLAKKVRLCLGLLSLFALFAGCTPSRLFVVPPPNWGAPEGAVVLLLPPDVRLSLLTAGGVEEQRADWTHAAYTNLKLAFANALASRGIRTVLYEDYGQVIPWKPEHAPMVKLHEAVGGAILTSPLLPTQRTKRPHLDHSLGGAVDLLRSSYAARYAILGHSRAAYASGGRVALTLLAAIGGVALPPGTQREFVSLVDLEDGKVIWFNVLPERGSMINSADARTVEGAKAMVAALLDGLPL